jgi:nitroreductase
MFLQNIMVAARARGLDTCPQASWLDFPHVIARVLELPDSETVVCGMALGYADATAAEGRLVPEREPLARFATLAGFE